MSIFCCPFCGDAFLSDDQKSLVCSKNHCFDRAKSSYVNLLPSNKMHSKTPGDNKLMIDTRNEFLSKGYYAVLKDELCSRIASIGKKRSSDTITLLDVGCGEGYYTAAIADTLKNNNIKSNIAGVDISKFGLNVAAKRTKDVSFAVASLFSLPIADHSIDILVELFAPYCGEEFLRVLKKGGFFISVIPSTDHLFELKEAVYDHPYKNEVKEYSLNGFTLIDQTKICSEIHIDNHEDIKNLFMMTPYYYKTSKEDTNRLLALHSLTTKIQFEILIYQAD